MELNGDQHSLRELEARCRGMGDSVLVSEQYWLDPVLFAQIDDHEPVKTIPQREVDFLNEYARLFPAAYRKIAVGNIRREQPDKPKVHHATITEGLTLPARLGRRA